MRGEAITTEKNIGTVANMYPGRLVVRETTDYDIKVADGKLPPVGWLGYESCNPSQKPATIDTIYVVEDKAPVLSGGKFIVRGLLAKGFVALEGDDVFSWGDGKVAIGAMINGIPAIRFPFVQKASAFDTNIDVPGEAVIKDCLVHTTTGVGGSSIDVGFINAVESGDEDGLLDGESSVSAIWQTHNLVDATRTNITLGALLKETEGKDAWALFYAVPKLGGYVTDGTIKSLCYVTSAHAVAGDVFVLVSSPGIKKVGKVMASVSAASDDANIWVESDL
jgi:hypothetical protein